MKYFDGIEWLTYGNTPNCRDWIKRTYVFKYGIHYTHTGSLIAMCYKGKIYELSGPCCWIIYPGLTIEYGVNKPEHIWHNRFINFAGARISTYIESGLFPEFFPFKVIDISQPGKFLADFEDLYDSLGKDYDRSVNKLETLLLTFNEEQNIINRGKTPQFDKLSNLKEKIELNYNKKWNFREEAKKMKLSESHLRKLFRDHFKYPPKKYLLNYRLEKSKQLLLTSDMTTKEIAFSVGFDDYNYFCRFFRKHFGVTSKEMRLEAE